MPRLVYRIDGGVELGLGHLARAVALTGAFRTRAGWSVVWATAAGRFVEAAAGEAGATLVRTGGGEGEAEFLARASEGADAVVVDRKLPYGCGDLEAVKQRCPVVLLDTPCDGMFAADAAVFPTAHLDPAIIADLRWRAGGRLLHGAEWAVVHPRVRAAAAGMKDGPDVSPRVAIVTGGSDPADVSSQALGWLDALPGQFAVALLVGIANRGRDALARRVKRSRHPTVLIDDPASFPYGLLGAALAVATFGVTAYELAFLGVPAVLVSHSEENAADAARFAKHGTALDLGLAARLRPDAAAAAIGTLLADEEGRRRMASAGRALVDGRGAERLADLVENLVRERIA